MKKKKYGFENVVIFKYYIILYVRFYLYLYVYD